MAARPKTGNKDFGDRVKAKRRMLGWSQVRLAAESGLSQNFISQVETGSASLSKDNERRIADALRENPSHLRYGVPGVPKELELFEKELVRQMSEKRKQIRRVADLTDDERREIAREAADFLAARLARLPRGE